LFITINYLFILFINIFEFFFTVGIYCVWHEFSFIFGTSTL